MSHRIELLMPYGEMPAAQRANDLVAAGRLKSLAGATVGVVWNSWHCMETIADELRGLLVDRFGAKSVELVQTPTTLPMPDEQVIAAGRRWDAAIVGLGT